MTTVDVPSPAAHGSVLADPAPGAAGRSEGRGVHRFVVAAIAGLAVVTVPFVWILTDLWSGGVALTRQLSPDNFYDLQGHALLAGHLSVPTGSLGIEAFVHGGRDYTYFGLFPALIRLPVLAFTHSFDGRLTVPSMLAAWVVTCLFASLLLWRVRVLIRGDAAIGWGEAAASGLMLAALTGGSVLLYLASAPRVSHEDLAWSAGLAIGATFALAGVLERPSWGRVSLAGVLVLAASLDRAPTGYACCIAAGLVACWLALPSRRDTSRRWVLPMALVAGVPLAVSALVNWSKFGIPFGLAESDQVWTHLNAHRRAYLAASGGSGFGLQFLPTTLNAYFSPLGLHLQSAFPWITLPTRPAPAVGNVVMDATYPTDSFTASMPLLALLGLWGLVTAFRPRPIGRVARTRVLLVAMVAATSGVMLFGYVADRYLADFLPFLALAGSIGLVDVWRRIDGARRGARIGTLAAVAVLAAFGVWANVGAAVAPSAIWTTTQARNFLDTQLRVTPTATAGLVATGQRLPYFAPAGTIFAMSDCSGVYVSTGFSYATVPAQQLMHQTWDPVVQGAGITHLVQVVFHRPVVAGDPPVTLLTWGPTRVLLVPAGLGTVRTVVEDPGGPPGVWPPLATAPQHVAVGTAYTLEVVTDPNLQMVLAGGLGGGIVHYLAGPGPAVVPPSSDPTQAAVTDVTGPPPSTALCRHLLKVAHRG